ncbi:hypothetical protein [Rhizobacter fulvus]
MAAAYVSVARELSFRTLGQHVSIRCDDVEAAELLAFCFSAIRDSGGGGETGSTPVLTYLVRRIPSERIQLICPAERSVECEGWDDVLYALEHDLTVSLQRKRPELLFIHAAALERSGRAYLLAGASGDGKSTTAWGLLHRGFNYLSDELSPIDVSTLRVHPYPRALSLKRLPPTSHPLPAAGVRHLKDTVRIGAETIPVSGMRLCPIDSIVFVRHDRLRASPTLRRLSSAEAGARLYTASLNALAHPDQGLDVALRTASRMRCFELEAADLTRTCDLFCEQVPVR